MSAPFSRFRALILLASALCAKSPGLSLLAAVEKHGGYKSRGKGQGKPGKKYGAYRSKYRPHYGAKESANFAARNPELRTAA